VAATATATIFYWRKRWLPKNIMAYSRGCTITYDLRVDFGWIPKHGWDQPWWRWCRLTIHEMGHIYGRGHSSNPESIMAPAEDMNTWGASWWPYFPACE
jgi:hypothetical protein